MPRSSLAMRQSGSRKQDTSPAPNPALYRPSSPRPTWAGPETVTAPSASSYKWSCSSTNTSRPRRVPRVYGSRCIELGENAGGLNRSTQHYLEVYCRSLKASSIPHRLNLAHNGAGCNGMLPLSANTMLPLAAFPKNY
jgi:hypothetical protein